MSNIIGFGFQEKFIERMAGLVAAEFLDRGYSPRRLAFVFGGRRPALFMKHHLARIIGKGFVSPVFFSMDEFIDRIVAGPGQPAALVSELDACWTIYKLARARAPRILQGRSTFAGFLPWAHEILSFIEQLDLEAIEDTRLRTVERTAAIGYDVPESINLLLGQCSVLRTGFHEQLRRRRLWSRGTKYLDAARLIGETELNEFDVIFFCNVFYLHATEKTVIETLYRRHNAWLAVQGDPAEFSVLKDLADSLGVTINALPETSHEPSIECLRCFDTHSQVGAVRTILEDIPRHDETVIVVPQPEKIIPLLSEIASLVHDCNVSLGYPADRSSLFWLLTAMVKAQETRKEDDYYTPDYLAVMTHPFVKNLSLPGQPDVTRVLVHSIEEMLIGLAPSGVAGSRFVSLESIAALDALYTKARRTLESLAVKVSKALLNDTVRTIHDQFFGQWKGVRSFRQAAACLRQWCGFLGDHSSIGRYPLNLKICEAVIELAGELESSACAEEQFDQHDLFAIILAMLAGRRISFTGSPINGLQVLGLFETRALNFNNVIVMDAQESVLPRVNIYEPLIPREVMLSLGLNRLEKEEEIQRYHFFRLAGHAERLFVLYEEGKDKEKSRFVEEILWSRQKQRAALDVVRMRRPRFSVDIMPKKDRMPKTAAIVSYLKAFEYSPTSITTYLNCPLCFYFRYVLRLKEKEEFSEQPQAKAVGTFLHSLLEEAFRPFTGKKPPRFDKKFTAGFFDLFEEKFKTGFEQTMRSDAFLLKEVMRYRLQQFLSFESTRQVKSIHAVERRFEATVPMQGIGVRFVLRVDRIDTLPDSSMLFIDYKTSDTRERPKDIAKIEAAGTDRLALKRALVSFQLPLYLCLLRSHFPGRPVNAALYNLRRPQLDFLIKPLTAQSIERAESIFRVALSAVLQEIIDPEICFEADEEQKYGCQNCSFFSLCR
ncbi:MAG: PD-(D/E)XK nuclease family protein [Candidatus Omnitrophica bacterium]|nr:PD-(D/E)XK nuclease family protein [Candidatus Omnitrophota bacterium]